MSFAVLFPPRSTYLLTATLYKGSSPLHSDAYALAHRLLHRRRLAFSATLAINVHVTTRTFRGSLPYIMVAALVLLPWWPAYGGQRLASMYPTAGVGFRLSSFRRFNLRFPHHSGLP